MRKHFFAVILLVGIIGVLLIQNCFAQARTPGVSVGMEFTYSQRSFWESSDPNLVQPAGLADINMTDYYRVTVTGITGSNVSTHTKWHFLNGSDVEKDGSVSTETTAYQGGFWALIGSNLNASDRVHPNSESDLSIINETVAWDYSGFQRQANHLILAFTGEKSDIAGSDYTENVDTYFDRQTGALIQLEDNHAYSNPVTTLAVTWRLVSQNAWTGSENGQDWSLIAVVAAVIVASIVALSIVLVYRKRRQSRRKL